MNQSPQPNLHRGIAAYLNPVREMAIREETPMGARFQEETNWRKR